MTEFLNQIDHPYLDSNNITIEQVGKLTKLTVNTNFACQTQHELITNYLKSLSDQEISVDFNYKIIPHKVKAGIIRLKNIKNIIAVTSGKGGVGKSTTAINLALALKNNGANVGLLDADIYGPSVPTLVGAKEYKPDVEDAMFVPLDKFGIKIMSFGFLISENQPAIWRGSIVNKALDQMLIDTKWGELDYLVIDMPPGTGDIHLTMCQKMPITANIAVTTPQDIALIDVKKSIAMYQKMDIPCLGLVENMSTHICSNCGHVEDIFGSLGAEKLSQEFQYPVLAKLPLNINIRLSCDNGYPITAENSTISEIYNKLATDVGLSLSRFDKDYSTSLGKINIVK